MINNKKRGVDFMNKELHEHHHDDDCCCGHDHHEHDHHEHQTLQDYRNNVLSKRSPMQKL